jgi:putative endonuclease
VTEPRGRRAERAVEELLVARGFDILARNLRLGALEIDLVARLGPLVAVVEVRSRGTSSYQRALASITPKKRATLLRAAERLWRERISKMADVERLRIDVAAVSFARGETHVEYIEGALTA